MHISTITQKGQVTIPIDIRNQLGLHEGDKVQFNITSEGVYLIPAKKVDLMSLYGALPKPKKTLSTEEINNIIEKRK